jgi:hypothetical protein
MQPILSNVAALAVALIFYVWRAHTQSQQQLRSRRLRERVAYMLWVMALKGEECEHSLSMG